VKEGIMPKNNGKPWTREDVKALREQARDRNVSTGEIAKKLGRTVAAVRTEAQRKSISLKPKNS
jgi:IS30 family transposase